MPIQKLILIAGFWISLAGFSLAATTIESSATLNIEGVARHPAMALTPEDVALGRENYKSRPWAKPIGDTITSACSVWLDRDANWIKQHMPGPAACFAYGFAGCPECGGKTGYWDKSICSFDDPGHVKCENGHSLPNDKYPDAGKGYKGPDGRMHYFVGTYNAWVIENFQSGAYNLAYAYSLTGDERYATRCVEILDALANIYRTCVIGSWDYPETRPGQNSGRFNRPFYQVGRVLITLADTYDQVFNSPSMREPSVRAGLTRQQNIEKNMLEDGAWYCYEKSKDFHGLTNGSADYIKGAMVVGLVVGIPQYVEWAVDGPYGIRSMLSNNIGRDGTYYETATGYAYYTRAIYRGYAEYLLNYRGSAYPNGVNLYENPRFRDFMLLHDLKTQIGGALPSYGDAAPTIAYTPEDTLFEKYDFECLLYLLERTTDPAEKQQYLQLLESMTDGNPEKYFSGSPSSRWLLFHAKKYDYPKAAADSITEPLKHSDFLGQKGMAMLRAGNGKDAQGVLLRYGPSLNHSNFDELNFSYYALGHDLTYDLGYALASAHVYVGFSKQTASHQLVVVDEKSQGYNNAPTGGSLDAFWSGHFTSAVRASNPGTYRNLGVSAYDRTLMLVSDSHSTSSYLLDIFQVVGGHKHDSFTHSLGKDLKFGNATATQPTSSSLAGGDMVWGDKILVDGDVAGQANKPYWLAPPGNGYGFLVEPRQLTPEGQSWWADWSMPKSKDRLRVWFPTDEAEKAVSAWGPGILKDLPDASYVVRRREPTDGNSTFVSVWEPYSSQPVITAVEMLPVSDNKSSTPAVAVKVTHADGTVDLLYAAVDDSPKTFEKAEVAGRFGRLTIRDGKCESAEGLALAELKYAGQDLLQDKKPARFGGKVSAIDVGAGTIETDAKLPAGDSVNGLSVAFSNPAYSRSTSYRIVNAVATTTGTILHLDDTCETGRGIVDKIDSTSKTITTPVSHEYAKPGYRGGDSEFFKGKRISGKDGQSAHIMGINVDQPMVLKLDNTSGFTPGDEFIYEDVQAGDAFEILIPFSRE